MEAKQLQNPGTVQIEPSQSIGPMHLENPEYATVPGGQVASWKFVTLFICLLVVVFPGIGGLIGIFVSTNNASAYSQAVPLVDTPTFTSTPLPLFTPPRGLSEDLWADRVIGKPNFEFIVPNTTTDNKLFLADGGGVIVYPDPAGKKLLVYDGGNNRILGVDIASCMATPTPPPPGIYTPTPNPYFSIGSCKASFVIGQPNLTSSNVNGDSGFQGFPNRKPASAESLSLSREDQHSLGEGGSGMNMAVDDWGRIYVTDYWNHRVLMYPSLFAPGTATSTSTPTVTPISSPTGTPHIGPAPNTNTPTTLTPTRTPTVTSTGTSTPTPIEAIAVWGQVNAEGTPDFTGNSCNGVLPFPPRLHDEGGNLLLPPPPFPSPEPSLLCFAWGQTNNWIAGVEIDKNGGMWVVDSGNNRVLHYPNLTPSPFTTPGVPALDPDIVLGQPGLTSHNFGGGLSELHDPSAVRIDPETGQIYVADTGNHRVMVYPSTPHPVATSTLFPNQGTVYKTFHDPTNPATPVRPMGLDFDPSRHGLWINERESHGDVGRVALWGIIRTPTATGTPHTPTNTRTSTATPTECSPSCTATSTATPTITDTPLVVLNGLDELGASAGSIGIDIRGEATPSEWVFVSALRGSHRNDIGVFEVPKSPNPLPSISPTPVNWLFGGSPGGNFLTQNGLSYEGPGTGLAVTNNPTPQLITIDKNNFGGRILYWNNPASTSGDILLDNGSNPTNVLNRGPYQALKATSNYLYVSTGEHVSNPSVEIYHLPLNASATPVATISYPFYTVGTGTPTSINAATQGTFWGLAPASDDSYLWVVDRDANRALRVLNPITPVPTPYHNRVDVVLGQDNVTGISCNGGNYLPAAYHLCKPGAASLDRKGNLWISDFSLERDGNNRLLEYDASTIPTPNPNPSSGAMSFAIPAKRIFPNLRTWEPAFDSNNRMVVGYNGLRDDSAPLPPSPVYTPLPGTPTPGSDYYAEFRGRFPGVYNHPLSVPTVGPSGPLPAPSPDAELLDFYSNAMGATFDQHDNLYVKDANRSRIMIYDKPVDGTPVIWATPLVNVTAAPTDNSLTRGTETPEAWDAGAVSVQAIGAGNGHIRMTVNQTNTNRAFGLTRARAYHGHRLEDLDYAFVLADDGTLAIYEGGEEVTLTGTVTPTYNDEDLLEVAIETQLDASKLVRYYQNGDAIYTSTRTVRTTDYPFVFDTSIASSGGQIFDAFIAGNTLINCASSGWCRQETPNQDDGPNVLNGVAVLSHENGQNNDVWAVGGYTTAEGGKPLINYWNGSEWRKTVEGLDLPFGIGVLNGISAIDHGNFWAIGDNKVLYSIDGEYWTEAHSSEYEVDGGKVIAAFKDGTTTKVWTIGNYSQGIQHAREDYYYGIVWDHTYSTINATTKLYGINEVSPNDVWAVGSINSTSRPIIFHMSGGSTPTVTAEYAPYPDGPAALYSVAGSDANHAWSVGYYHDSGANKDKTLTEFWDGYEWTIINSDTANVGDNTKLKSVWFDKEGNVWASGEYRTSTDPSNPKPLVVRWNDMSWEQVDVHAQGASSQLSALSTQFGDSAVVTNTWAVGSYAPQEGAPSQTLLENLQAPTAPITATTAYYETDVDQRAHGEQGCLAASRRESGVIMLNYGEPKHWDDYVCDLNGCTDYGTSLLGTHDAAYIAGIRAAVESFAEGYHECILEEQESDNPPNPPAHITIAVSITNDNHDDDAALTQDHAEQWAQMVSDLYTYVHEQGMTEIDVAGGISLHPDPDWSSYEDAYTWVDAYNSASDSICYNFGTTDGYPAGEPESTVPLPWASPTPSAWTAEELYNISWTVPGMQPFPLIFEPTWARNWYRVKKWAIESEYEPLQFAGAAAECHTTACGGGASAGHILNTEQAWQMLHLQLNSDPDQAMHEKVEGPMEIKCSSGDITDGCAP